MEHDTYADMIVDMLIDGDEEGLDDLGFDMDGCLNY